ncbi:ADP-ribosylglycohydrolase family protein [Flammeovirga aprica]|uniref:ADP-ribosylglycohydrolase family protein n=1 Tax=Flammeovirga aprica JL-4 TaxID=694437 RepID=A0A7X9XC54_9BACT|nr:ADP-ribosylglycohydrolase family protein [Flammeovirga aprica]NME71395.1 ADP-ribosylglycohydrolase family protein [Flammeovirga aprica JL-4]
MKNTAKDLLFGVAVGDALGVPFEFSSRAQMKTKPAKDMVGYKTHNQPLGTWSDDSSLTFCLAESLTGGYSLLSLSKKMIQWKNENYWTARGEVFDIGITTSKAISKLEALIDKGKVDELHLLKYDAIESDNGNGSLMRILPLLFEVKNKDIEAQFDIIWENSALTHPHIRAAMSCLIYLKFAEYLMKGIDKFQAYKKMQSDIINFWQTMNFSVDEQSQFERIIQNDINNLPEDQIMSGGYVIESLEASLWSFLNTDNFESSVLKAINFGHDTDTTAAITGGLSGIYYGFENIPVYWVISLAKMEEIEELVLRLHQKFLS